MTGVWIFDIVLLLLCLGALVGTSWTIHVLDRRYRSLASERR